MKYLVFAIALLVLCVGCDDTITGQMLKDVNERWMKNYNSHRRMTPDEAKAYAALDDAGKDAWRKEGKPTDRPLSPRSLDSVLDFYKGTAANAEAAIKKNE